MPQHLEVLEPLQLDRESESSLSNKLFSSYTYTGNVSLKHLTYHPLVSSYLSEAQTKSPDPFFAYFSQS